MFVVIDQLFEKYNYNKIQQQNQKIIFKKFH